MAADDAERLYGLGLWAMLASGMATLSVFAEGQWTSAMAISVSFVMIAWTTSNMAWLRTAREHYLRPGHYPYIGV